jgi:plasmid stabilization system protein ParE
MQPRITKQAESDLEEAWDYVAERNLRAADRLLDRILERARLHARFPLMGRPIDDLLTGARFPTLSVFTIPPTCLAL